LTDSARAPIRVLLADDDPPVRAVLSDVLTGYGHEVVATAATGSEAIELTRSARPDVVLLDVHMPDGSGLDAARTIARDCPDVAVILFTGDETLALSDADAAESSAIAFLRKPTPPVVLDAQVRLAYRRAQVEREARQIAEDALSQLEERKLVERAKGVLMRKTGGTEDMAYRTLQRTSQERSMPMIDIARAILASDAAADT
jgi:AmiR/NasT family two-component response regulator